MTSSERSPSNGMSAVSLDDVLVALQKSFSRLSASSRSVPDENARALITGVVDFEITSDFEMALSPNASLDDSADVLIQQSNGTIRMTLKGQVETDIRLTEATEFDDAKK
tara:strand:+ start:148 stop:477 length:330 start_codon:yes stop_codon:yes gene_type:complete